MPKLRGELLGVVLGSTGGALDGRHQGQHNEGYLRIHISGECLLVHRAVYQAIRGELAPGMVVHHKDENRQNNALRNLEAMPRGEHTALHARRRRRNK